MPAHSRADSRTRAVERSTTSKSSTSLPFRTARMAGCSRNSSVSRCASVNARSCCSHSERRSHRQAESIHSVVCGIAGVLRFRPETSRARGLGWPTGAETTTPYAYRPSGMSAPRFGTRCCYQFVSRLAADGLTSRLWQAPDLETRRTSKVHDVLSAGRNSGGGAPAVRTRRNLDALAPLVVKAADGTVYR